MSHGMSASNCPASGTCYKCKPQAKLEHELKEKSLERANEHPRFKADRHKFAKELYDPPNWGKSTFGPDRLLHILWRQIMTTNARQR